MNNNANNQVASLNTYGIYSRAREHPIRVKTAIGIIIFVSVCVSFESYRKLN